ncbi:Peptidoglycan/xylan/chitin deacetylase, PgdA/CDA1 family [Syntrophus gentianae]|uniref:Peptidoglycan/xylan/chitin deacetylase, PgdA/CDA1 family n=1 Tax=Syntrophus gentianae TaxID=43775 RepID=A0A1H7YG01_9BACT|nr:polysaccharide deacetylase family protein [Syntrophus gentianae]SEM44863.1 Peptidoglycan/xylan/chitin deacetylase, PgdA/CDA1 family [Syntrophus gentianae]
MKRFFPPLKTPALRAGLAALFSAAALFPMEPRWSILPLLLFVLSCLMAPFFPRWGYFLPVISRGPSNRRGVALTVDDGPDPEMTPRLLDLLGQRGMKATFFVTGRQVLRHPELIRKILAEGHTVGNHSFSHDVLLMLRSSRRLAEEIDRLQEVLSSFGIRPRVFRPPVGITNPRLGPVLRRRGMSCVNFDCRALDAGNRRIKGISRKLLKKMRPGSILLIHDFRPSEKTDIRQWITEIDALLEGIARCGYKVVPLQELTDIPVMEKGIPVA